MSCTKINSCSQFLAKCQKGLDIESDWHNKREESVEHEQHINYLFKHATLEQLRAVFKSREFGFGKEDTILVSCCDYCNPCFIAIESIASAALRLLPSHKGVVKDMLDFKSTIHINQEWESFKLNPTDAPFTKLGPSSLEYLLDSPAHPQMKTFFKELNDGLHIDESLLPTQLPSISFADKHNWVIQFFQESFENDIAGLWSGTSVTFRKQIRNASSKDVRDLAFSEIDKKNHVFAYCFKRAHKQLFDRVLKILVSKLSSQDISQLKTELGQSVSYQSLRERPVNELTTLEKKQLSIYRLMDSNSN